MRGSRSGKPPRRVNCYSDSFKYVLPDAPELRWSKLFARPISGIHPLYTTDSAPGAHFSRSTRHRTWPNQDSLPYCTEFIEFIFSL